MRGAVTLAVLVLAAVLLGATDGAAAPAQAPTLFGTVGPAFTITLRNAQGNPVTRLDPGTYELEVQDLSIEHSFHLRGPDVNRLTDLEGTGTESWTVTLTDGNYTYFCDPHSATMNGSVAVGNAPPPTPSPSGTPPVTAKTRIVLTAGQAEVITLKTAGGKVVKAMKLGTYTMTVRDRSRLHNAHVRAPGFEKRTTLNFVGSQKWKVKLAKVGKLRFLCDPHASTGMRGSASIVR